MRVLGIDPGSRHTGYAVVEERESRLRLLAVGTISPGDERPLPERLAEIFRGLANVLGRFGPDAVSVEEVFHAANARSALVLGQARGAALLAAAVRDIPVHEYSASEIKRAVAGTGRAGKVQVGKMVALVLGGEIPGDEHGCDAAAAAICHLHRARLPAAVRAPAPAAPAARRARGIRRGGRR